MAPRTPFRTHLRYWLLLTPAGWATTREARGSSTRRTAIRNALPLLFVVLIGCQSREAKIRSYNAEREALDRLERDWKEFHAEWKWVLETVWKEWQPKWDKIVQDADQKSTEVLEREPKLTAEEAGKLPMEQAAAAFARNLIVLRRRIQAQRERVAALEKAVGP